jgi:hypothetical protein
MDDQLRLIWSRVLDCDPQEIDNDMNFFECVLSTPYHWPVTILTLLAQLAATL